MRVLLLLVVLCSFGAAAEAAPAPRVAAASFVAEWMGDDGVLRATETTRVPHVPERSCYRWTLRFAPGRGRVRVQELFGLARHPALAGGRVPLVLELLSPAHRPIQTTKDLPGFWRGSWKDVRSDMRGRYPKHVWPEDPASAAPTSRAKPRGT